jgi:hypothetical protein
VELVDGEAQFFDPSGRRVPHVGARPAVTPESLESWLRDDGVEVTAETHAQVGWDADRLGPLCGGGRYHR